MAESSEFVISLESIPPSQELVDYYRKRVEQSERDYADALKRIESVKTSYAEKHHLEWELVQRSKEITELQKALSDSQTYLHDERKQLLKLLAENDRLRIQELKDRKKVRYLLALAKVSEDEITFFKKNVEKRFVSNDGHPEDLDDQVYQNARKARDISQMSFKEIYDLDESRETDLDVLRLMVRSLKAQLEEQAKLSDEQIRNLEEDRRIREEEFGIQNARDRSRIEELLQKNQKIENILRENTRDLLERKKRYLTAEKKLKEEKTVMVQDLTKAKEMVKEEKEKVQTIEKQVEKKVQKRQELLTTDLRNQVSRYESDLKEEKVRNDKLETVATKKMESMGKKAERAVANYNSLKKRREQEIEGFTNDINLLRKQVQIMENALVKQQQENLGPLEDRELLLLNMARETGRKASKISNELHNLKSKMYKVERDVRNLAF